MRLAMIIKSPDFHRPTLNKGFTLPEMAMVLVIVGMMLAGWVSYYGLYMKQRDINIAKDNIRLLASDIGYFRVLQDRYPCPAPMDVPRTDIRFGRSFANDFGTCTLANIESGACDPQDAVCNPLVVGLDPATITPANPSQCAGGICLVLGTRDVTGDGIADPIMVGAYPVRDMARRNESRSLSTPRGIGDEAKRNTVEGYEQDGIDPWGDQYLYAITLSLLNPLTFAFYNGTIGVQDEFGQPTAGVNNDGHFVLLSHGPNRRGAFSVQTGAQMIPCGQDPLDDPVNGAMDNENCDLDGTFVQALGNYESDTTAFYDDIIRVGPPEKTIIWDRLPDPATGLPTANLQNLNTGNVGVGMIAETESTGTLRVPTERLDVSGTLRSQRATRASGVCTHDGGLCFPISSIAGTGFRCPAGKVMKQIKGQGSLTLPLAATCVTPAFAPLTPRDCGPGKWIIGLKTNGDVICTGE